jgi:hypothetical protein
VVLRSAIITANTRSRLRSNVPTFMACVHSTHGRNPFDK